MELDRAKIVAENFINHVVNERFPSARSNTSLQHAELSKEAFLDLFDSQIKSRHLDLIARELKQKKLGFYTIGSSGHEGNAAVAKIFQIKDMAFLHYRSGAFMVQRGKQDPNSNAMEDILLSLLASKDDPIAAGRHKVFGSLALNVPPQTSTIASHLPKAVGAAISIARAKELNIKMKLAADSVILCSFGDASVNHSVAQGAFNTANYLAFSHYPLPLVLICEDNGIGISVPTPTTWIETCMRSRSSIHYLQCDGLNLADVYQKTKEAEHIARINKQPVFLHIKTVRLLGHAGSDIESQYLTEEKIIENEFNDPLLHSARIILENKFLTKSEMVLLYEKINSDIHALAEELLLRPKLNSAEEVMSSIIPSPSQPKRNEVSELTHQHSGTPPNQKRNLAQSINAALKELLTEYPNAIIFGEDVAKKGGVYRVTADLIEQFGQRRVFDTLLDETTILGTAIGFAMNGLLPVPEIQFLAYYHNAEDQIRGEASTLSFFSCGQFTNPMVIRIAGLAYQQGFGGHFHNDNSIAALRDVPGIIIACPSNGADAVKLLRTCFDLANRERRVVVFLEPIALYMIKDLENKGDNGWLRDYPSLNEQIALGEIGIEGDGAEIAIVTYGNGVYLSTQAALELKREHDIDIKIIDLRWLAPLNKNAIVAAVNHCKHILIVDECRRTGSLSEALMTLFIEHLHPLPNIKRLTAEDSFIPLGNAWKYVLPSKEDIIHSILGVMASWRLGGISQ